MKRDQNLQIYSFRPGWEALTRVQRRELKKEVKTVLNYSTNCPFYQRLNGSVHLLVAEMEAITKAFKKIGYDGQIWESKKEN